MAKIINKIKSSVAGITWPTSKSVCGDTIMVFITTVVLSSLIAVWSFAIETIVNWVTSML